MSRNRSTNKIVPAVNTAAVASVDIVYNTWILLTVAFHTSLHH